MAISCAVLVRTIAVLFLFRSFNGTMCLDFSFPTFEKENETQLILHNSKIELNAIQVTPDLSDPSRVMNMSGRALHHKAFKLWRKGEKDKTIRASFNSTFMLNISPYPSGDVLIGEGIAFILATSADLPRESEGKWLGIANENTTNSGPGIVAVEFDTRKSPRDTDGNHIGINVNGVDSTVQVSLSDYGINISGGSNITVRVRYDGLNISVFLEDKDKDNPVLSWPFDLTVILAKDVFVGFSASTGDNYFERNCVLSWDFHGTDIEDDDGNYLLWVWISVSVFLFFVLSVVLIVYMKRPCRSTDLDEEIEISAMAPKKFTLSELRRATGNFSPKNKLGQGGFGTVFKGLIGDEPVAVKRVSKDSRQGKTEFVAEVTTIGSLSHRNLVRLIGWCYEKKDLLIVYEFMPNGSLEKYLFGDDELSWQRRRGVISGVAQALEYLHDGCEKRVLHRDVKASNIMLDSDFGAKLGDFGLARAMRRSEKAHHTTREIAGTPGYMAPESFFTARATMQTDVYAFGVLVLEVVTGKWPRGFGDDGSFNNGLVLSIWRLYNAGRVLEVVDMRLIGEIEDSEVARVVGLGLACCHPNPEERPPMRTILKVLIGEEDPPALPEEIPAFVWPSSMPPSFKSDGETTLQGGQLTMYEITGR